MVIRVTQINVDRSDIALEIALEKDYEEETDMILVQEPWHHGSKRRSKAHPNYTAFPPNDKGRHRVITYVQKDIEAYQYLDIESNDMIEVHLPQQKLDVVNVYRDQDEYRLTEREKT